MFENVLMILAYTGVGLAILVAGFYVLDLLTPGKLGVANKTLPCGTRVTFHYHGHTARARVIDRGPYVYGREWDLTSAVKARLHFGSTGVVWSTR